MLMFVHKKLANMSKFSLMILMGISECWEDLFLSYSSMSFFISSILTSEKRNVSFSQLPCSATMLEWSLYLKIALRVRSAMFSVQNQTHFISKYSDSLLRAVDKVGEGKTQNLKLETLLYLLNKT